VIIQFLVNKAIPFIQYKVNGIFVNLNMTLVLLSIVLVALAVAGIAIKILVKKNGQFAGTCSGNNPMLQKESGVCGICGAKPTEKCKS
jgi:rRNA maturation endonuclease Nob1